MENFYEIIPYSSELPIRLGCYYVDVYQNSLSHETSIIFVLDGEINVLYEGESYFLKQDDIIVINENTVFSVSSNNSTVLALRFNMHNILKSSTKHINFKCNSSLCEDKKKYHRLAVYLYY